MNKSLVVKILGLGVIIVSLVGFIVLPFYRVTSKAQNVAHVLSVSQSLKEDNDQLRYQIDAAYPQFTSPSNQPVQNQINQLIHASIADQVARFKAELPKTSPRELKDVKSNLTITYDIARADSVYISIDFRVQTYFLGAAHPNTIPAPFNYDVKNNKPLTLADLFKADAKYGAVLSDKAIADLKKQYLGSTNPPANDTFMDDWIIKGAGPKEENFQKFLIKNNTLVILFDPYQVAAGVAGIQEVTIPASELTSIFAKPL